MNHFDLCEVVYVSGIINHFEIDTGNLFASKSLGVHLLVLIVSLHLLCFISCIGVQWARKRTRQNEGLNKREMYISSRVRRS